MASKRFTLSDLAKLTEAHLVGNPEHVISNIETLEDASSEDASFLANLRYKELVKDSLAGVICVDPTLPLIEGKNYLVSQNPSRAFQKIAEAFYSKDEERTGFEGIHPTAVVHPTAKLGHNVQIAPYAVIDRNTEIGDNTVICPFVSVGASSKIGSGCVLHPGSIVRERCVLGNRVILQPGAVIGSCGFGYTTTPEGVHVKLEQLGTVIIEDDVEIGANTTIDRGRFKATRIARGTKIDNLVQIAHNVHIGKGNLIAAQTGIAGSAQTGSYVMMGGQVGVLGHVEIADQAMIATRGGVSKSIKKAGKYRGSPAVDISEYNRQEVHVRKLDEYVKRIKELEKKLEALEAALKR
jgi:UDP-3-O-[3-hydroxymyristoyl] glucosamine N-acyltransferase